MTSVSKGQRLEHCSSCTYAADGLGALLLGFGARAPSLVEDQYKL